MTSSEFKAWAKANVPGVVSVRPVRTRPGVTRAFLATWYEGGNILEHRDGEAAVAVFTTRDDRERFLAAVPLPESAN